MQNKRPQVYPEWFAQRVVYCWFVLGWGIPEIAAHWWIGQSTVKRMVTRLKQNSPTLGAKSRTGKHYKNRKMKSHHIAFILHLLRYKSDMYLDEFAEALHSKFAVTVSLSTICLSLYRAGITRKQVGGGAVWFWLQNGTDISGMILVCNVYIVC